MTENHGVAGSSPAVATNHLTNNGVCHTIQIWVVNSVD